MEKLPTEIVFSILRYCVTNHYGDKNSALGLRTVCKLFNAFLSPFVLRTLQLEYTRLNKDAVRDRPPDYDALSRIGRHCRALYLDMMVIRDDEEVNRLGILIGGSDAPLLSNYCLNDRSFTELDYRKALGRMLEFTPNVSAVRLNLPFPIFVVPHPQVATMILGNSLETLAQRPEGSKSLETLFLEDVTGTTVTHLWRNPQDVKNIVSIFAGLRQLLISLRRPEEWQDVGFEKCLWQMIGKAECLQSLCLIGSYPLQSGSKRVKQSSSPDWTLGDWIVKQTFRVLIDPSELGHFRLRQLELYRVEVDGDTLLALLAALGSTLSELHLNEVYLRNMWPAGYEDNDSTLWIGRPNVRPQPHQTWIATALRQMNIRLSVCRANLLGYDQYSVSDPQETSLEPVYDLLDPCGLGRSFDQRFEEVASGVKQPNTPDGETIEYWPREEAQTWAYADQERPDDTALANGSAARHFADRNEWTPACMKTMDGHFANHNPFTTGQLQRFADVASRGMANDT